MKPAGVVTPAVRPMRAFPVGGFVQRIQTPSAIRAASCSTLAASSGVYVGEFRTTGEGIRADHVVERELDVLQRCAIHGAIMPRRRNWLRGDLHDHGRAAPARIRHPEPARRAASGPGQRRAGGPHLSDDLVRVRRYGSGRLAVQPGAAGVCLQPHIESDGRGARGAPGRARRRGGRGMHGERHGRDAHRHRDASRRRRSYRRFRFAVRRDRESVGAYATALRHHNDLREAARHRRLPRGNQGQYPAR